MRSKHKGWLVALLVVGILSPFIFLSSSLNPWQGKVSLASLTHNIVYPFEYLWHSAVGSLSSAWEHYVYLSNAARENDQLKRELAEIRGRVIDYDEQSLEIDRLRRLLGFAQHHEKRLLVAEIVGSLRLTPFFALRLSRGKGLGVKVGMPVVTPAGVVGKLIRVGEAFSDVQLLTDSNFYVDVLVQRTRTRGVIRGVAGTRCELNLHQKAEIRIGDTLVTSGIVGSFPKGIPVGHVVRISYESDHVSQAIAVEPWVDYRRIEEVFVVDSEDRELAKIIETVGFDWLEKSIDTKQTGGG